MGRKRKSATRPYKGRISSLECEVCERVFLRATRSRRTRCFRKDCIAHEESSDFKRHRIPFKLRQKRELKGGRYSKNNLHYSLLELIHYALLHFPILKKNVITLHKNMWLALFPGSNKIASLRAWERFKRKCRQIKLTCDLEFCMLAPLPELAEDGKLRITDMNLLEATNTNGFLHVCYDKVMRCVFSKLPIDSDEQEMLDIMPAPVNKVEQELPAIATEEQVTIEEQETVKETG